jgi:hypothetical protein
MSTTTHRSADKRDSIAPVSCAKWKHSEFLEGHKITSFHLAKTPDRRTRATTVYGLVRKGGDVSRVDLETLAATLDGLREITNQDVQVTDLIEYWPDN